MITATFLNSLPGTYVTQAFLHSLIAAVIADRALAIWNIENPRFKQLFSLIAIVLPLAAIPAYQIIDPHRGSLAFRVGALLDSGRWLHMDLFGIVSVGTLFLVLLGGTALVFFFQELLPVLRHTFETRHPLPDETLPPGDARVEAALDGLPWKKPQVVIIKDDPILYSRTGKNPAVIISDGLLEILDTEQLRSAIAHELAHIQRSRKPLLILVFILRIVMFFNPIALLEFRRAVHEEEKICDDIAVSLTGKSEVLAETLRRFSLESASVAFGTSASEQAPADAPQGRALFLENRIRRLEHPRSPAADPGWQVFCLTLAVITAINYFIV